jgi:hypothetical protein
MTKETSLWHVQVFFDLQREDVGLREEGLSPGVELVIKAVCFKFPHVV